MQTKVEAMTIKLVFVFLANGLLLWSNYLFDKNIEHIITLLLIIFGKFLMSDRKSLKMFNCHIISLLEALPLTFSPINVSGFLFGQQQITIEKQKL